MSKDFSNLIKEIEMQEISVRKEMSNYSKKLVLLLEEKKLLIKENNQINQMSIEASTRLICMSRKSFCENVLNMEDSFRNDKDFINIGYEWYGYDIEAKTLIEDDVFIDLLIISCGDAVIKKVFLSKQGLNKNIMKRFYYKISKKELTDYISNKYSDKFITKANARTTMKG